MSFLTLVQRACTLALIGVIAGVAHSWATPIRLNPAAPASAPEHAQSAPAGGAGPGVASVPALGLDISVDQSWELFQQGAPFVDARLLEEFEAGHVEGAFWLPSAEFMNGHSPEALTLMDKASPLVVYCGGGLCDASKNTVVLLQQAGFTRCHIMTEGYPAWVSAGRPVGTGKPGGG